MSVKYKQTLVVRALILEIGCGVGPRGRDPAFSRGPRAFPRCVCHIVSPCRADCCSFFNVKELIWT